MSVPRGRTVGVYRAREDRCKWDIGFHADRYLSSPKPGFYLISAPQAGQISGSAALLILEPLDFLSGGHRSGFGCLLCLHHVAGLLKPYLLAALPLADHPVVK